MKLVLAIIKDGDSDVVIHALTDAGFRVTRIASTGGFLRKGVATLLIGVEDEQLESALEILRTTTTAVPGEKRLTLFVMNVARFEQV
jgi:uncharacterized protein YaaQ